jgi:hypothetical protein
MLLADGSAKVTQEDEYGSAAVPVARERNALVSALELDGGGLEVDRLEHAKQIGCVAHRRQSYITRFVCVRSHQPTSE